MKKRCVIVAGGSCDISLMSQVESSDYVIAADSGLKHCLNAGISPDLIVGDFDSYSDSLPDCIEIIKLPTHKDDTDLLFAARCAVERGFKSFLILGGYGSRPDQNFAMLSTLCWLKNNDAKHSVKAVCNGFEIVVLKNESAVFLKNVNRYLSVFAFDGNASNVSICGAEYNLSNAELSPSFPVGVSNQSISDTTISVEKGCLIVMSVDKSI